MGAAFLSLLLKVIILFVQQGSLEFNDYNNRIIQMSLRDKK